MTKEKFSELVNALTEDALTGEGTDETLSSLRQSYAFRQGFRERVMEAVMTIPSARPYDDFSLRLSSLFMKVAVSGVAAIVILAISVFLSWGNVSFDSLLGLGDVTDESMITLLTESF